MNHLLGLVQGDARDENVVRVTDDFLLFDSVREGRVRHQAVFEVDVEIVARKDSFMRAVRCFSSSEVARCSRISKSLSTCTESYALDKSQEMNTFRWVRSLLDLRISFMISARFF